MKIDIHSHILPGIDDGAKTLEESVQLVTEMAGWGFERLTCTPHITKKFRNTPEIIQEKFDILNNALSANGLNINLRISAEYRLNPETWPEILKSGQFMPIEDRYILMEFPINEPSDMGDLNPMEEFLKVMSLGLTPILPHPERYFYLQHDDLLRYVDAGVKIQSNYGSLAGVYGSEVCKRAQALIDEGIVSFLATDMHNMQYIKTISSWLDEGNQLWDMQ
jgi:tyrosine-protein phosphatase YwqE